MKIFATCTFFAIKVQTLISIGKNYDVPSLCYGLIFWNPAGFKSILIKPSDEPAEWTSKYGNNIFNQVERDFPASGLNEKGLVAEQTILWNSIYPERDNRKPIKELQLIQYISDICSTTAEAIECFENVSVSQEMAESVFT